MIMKMKMERIDYSKLQIDKENELKFDFSAFKDIPKKCGVYKIGISGSDKYYIGSSCNIHKRIIAHKNLLKLNKHANKYLQNITNKYGLESIEITILELCDIVDQYGREQYYVDLLKPEINLKIVDINTSLGLKASDETRLKMSQTRKGHITSEETKEKIRESQGSKVAQLNKDMKLVKIWKSMNECEKFGFSHSAISNVCRKKRKSHKGYIWILYDEYISIKDTLQAIKKPLGTVPTKTVHQYDLQNNFIREYNSAKDAVINSEGFFSEEGIRSCCRGKTKSHKSFIFKYGD